MGEFLAVLERGLAELALSLTPRQILQCRQFYDLLSEWNQKINLTAVKGAEDAAVKHFLDSLAAGRFFAWNKDSGGKILDMGAGAGFPGLVLKIWRPSVELTLVDTVQKKVGFLNSVVGELGLTGVEAVHARAEDLGQSANHREKYDLVTARAVASLATLSEYCLPFLAPGGFFYALKGPNYQDELAAAGTALTTLGGEVTAIYHYPLPLLGDGRVVIVIKKVRKTPKSYPRQAGMPGKKPLGVAVK